ncbi:lysine N(6)-hydroxylase/L-ornithine N(5)-oxygenase family protein [Psychrobacter sp. DAB_AL32B]|uniref:lysine N(6)-hydroxylase/L-ornithine N(5)-oxygenase family protein n=1 Tax=Psychrobacter sp. DAB_AL32B TaxID=1028414 RepID=UPI000B800014|nr:SidA/IucD/PvdA family monooxygenase [Psychrobacter sp. DAB_AL32B]OXL26124.1 ornithine monooxygenase [Psychrobacter sp. DAB_AL32B]
MIDLIGIGLGPFNLSLAALLENQPTVTSKFFEQKKEFNWHKGMIFPHTTLQVPFMADLVTLIDPTSRYTFLNYLHAQHRLLKFYILEDFEIYRKEYNHYCQWVAGQLNSAVFETTVIDVALKEDGNGFNITVCEHGENKTYMAKNIVIGTGSQPILPPFLQQISERVPYQCMHTANFSENFNFTNIRRTDKLTKVLVLGSGQSAAEVYQVLFDQQFDENNAVKFQLDWMTRSAGFFPMEYTPLGLEHFSPAYINYFHHLKPITKANVVSKQDLLHKGISAHTIKAIYHKLYERSIANQEICSTITSNCELLDATLDSTRNNMISLTLRQHEQDSVFSAEYDCVITGTGYKDTLPECMSSLLSAIKYDEFEQPKINRNYTLAYKNHSKDTKDSGRIFVQNKETHSHGIGAGDLGLGAYRSGCIVNELMGKQVYDTEALQVFQNFGKFV